MVCEDTPPSFKRKGTDLFVGGRYQISIPLFSSKGMRVF